MKGATDDESLVDHLRLMMQSLGVHPRRGMRFWGKSADSSEANVAWHALEFHSLDVAAAGLVLLDRNRRWRRQFAALCGVDEQLLFALLPFLLALHDIGKFADGFQALRPDLMMALQGESRNPGYPLRHDTLGFWFWWKHLSSDFLRRQVALFPLEDAYERQDAVAAWFASIAGHHGRPPKQEWLGCEGDLRRQFPASVQSEVRAFESTVEAALVPHDLVAPVGDVDTLLPRLRRSSHWLAGWATTADWIGSNLDWFPFRSEETPLAEYWWEHALPRSRNAVSKSGLGERRPASEKGFRGLWPRQEWTPSPLQQLAGSIPLGQDSQLLIIEDVTGAGKTEAALLLAHRMIASGSATGIYFALPTMATANAMYPRVRDIYQRLFAEQESSSLVLAHSRRDLFLPLEKTRVDDSYESERAGETSASLDCAAWLADSRKKALLAQVGVGTIDQALVSVLPIRHQSLRLAGLAGKVLIVDEVHACDRYVLTLLECLLEFHAAFGGSAILLSATLPCRQREGLLAAFARGSAGPSVRVSSDAYPLLTQLTPEKLDEIPLETRPAVRRSVEIKALRSEKEAEDWLLGACEAGGCACWVRNTVRDAVAGYDRLVARWGEDRVLLFHSRFTVADRREIEERVLAISGPKSGPDDRRGKLLVATQVVEQSLDLDFDAMVTDLAPMDLIIQRAGRLRRHPRAVDGRLSTEDQRGEAVLGVLSPEPAAEPGAEWFSNLFPSGAHVYPDHGRLWLTVRWLEARGRLRMPEDAREAIESIYGTDSEESIPSGLQRASLEAEGKAQAGKSVAWANELKLNAGYATTATEWIEDTATPTRLGEPTTTLRLVRRTATGLEPWAGRGAHQWEASEVTVLRARVAFEEEGEESMALRATMRDSGRYCLVVILEPEGNDLWRGKARSANGMSCSVLYSSRHGLRVEK